MATWPRSTCSIYRSETMNKATYIRYKNAIKRWQSEPRPQKSGGGNGNETSNNAVIMHCGVCRERTPFSQVETKRPGQTLLYKCNACGHVNRRPNPECHKYPLGMALVEQLERNGMKGMSMVLYNELVECGCPPIDERPFLDEKRIVAYAEQHHISCREAIRQLDEQRKAMQGVLR